MQFVQFLDASIVQNVHIVENEQNTSQRKLSINLLYDYYTILFILFICIYWKFVIYTIIKNSRSRY